MWFSPSLFSVSHNDYQVFLLEFKNRRNAFPRQWTCFLLQLPLAASVPHLAFSRLPTQLRPCLGKLGVVVCQDSSRKALLSIAYVWSTENKLPFSLLLSPNFPLDLKLAPSTALCFLPFFHFRLGQLQLPTLLLMPSRYSW